eukprot:7375606-Alexandrium_andersonii.AAC.1
MRPAMFPAVHNTMHSSRPVPLPFQLLPLKRPGPVRKEHFETHNQRGHRPLTPSTRPRPSSLAPA